MELLHRLGLRGSFQFHLAPVVLVPDERAHQVYSGFGIDTGQQALGLIRRGYDPALRVSLVRDDEATSLSLREAADYAWTAGDSLVVPARRVNHAGGLYGLVWVVDRLLGPGGCPWDQAQTHATLKRHLIEEAYELVDAIDGEDSEKMKEELGDVLLQPLMHAQIEALAGRWDTDTVAGVITEKLVRRHPHVFGDTAVANADEVLRNWDAIKTQEKGGSEKTASILDGVPRAMPALLRAYEVSKRAARNGFEWQDIDGVWEKLREEEAEIQQAVETGEGVAEEVGDLLFTVVNIARWLGVEPEDALRQMVDRFTTRFQAMERMAGRPLRELTFDEWDVLWNTAKAT